MIEVSCATPDDTRALAMRLASLVRPGDVVLLKGSLGAGKTVFVGGLAAGLGVQEQVTSPTFVIARRYEGFMPLLHADVYRIGSSAEIEDLDLLGEAGQGLLVVEWGYVVDQQLGEDHLLVSIVASDDESRLISLLPSGSWSDRPLEDVTS